MEPHFPISNARMREWDEIQGDYQDARQRLIAVQPTFEKIAVQPGKQGYWRGVLQWTQQEIQRSGETYNLRINSATAYAQLGDRDKSLAWLQKSYEAKDDLLPAFVHTPLFDSLHSEPRYAALLKNMDLPD
jgi:hypothetical protein